MVVMVEGLLLTARVSWMVLLLLELEPAVKTLLTGETAADLCCYGSRCVWAEVTLIWG